MFVRTPSTRAIPMNIDLNGTVDKLKSVVQAIHSTPTDQQLLSVDGVQDDHRVSDNIRSDSTLQLTLRLLGGEKQGGEKNQAG